jgi:hypothetical protein
VAVAVWDDGCEDTVTLGDVTGTRRAGDNNDNDDGMLVLGNDDVNDILIPIPIAPLFVFMAPFPPLPMPIPLVLVDCWPIWPGWFGTANVPVLFNDIDGGDDADNNDDDDEDEGTTDESKANESTSGGTCANGVDDCTVVDDDDDGVVGNCVSRRVDVADDTAPPPLAPIADCIGRDDGATNGDNRGDVFTILWWPLLLLLFVVDDTRCVAYSGAGDALPVIGTNPGDGVDPSLLLLW